MLRDQNAKHSPLNEESDIMKSTDCSFYLQSSPYPLWTGPAAQQAPSAWDPECLYRDSGWSSDPLYKFGRIRSSDLSICSWDLHPGLENLSPEKQGKMIRF